MHKHFKYFLAIAFIEGAAVMAVELTGAKLIAPWFGTSLYVWASVLGVTMMGLAAGYFLGGWWSERMQSTRSIFVFLAAASLFTGIMPLTGDAIMSATLGWEIRWGALTSSLVFILPPMLLLGTLSPMLIRASVHDTQKAGRISGWIYATSTVGGVITTFLMGFYLIPSLGLKRPVFLFAALLALPVLIRLFAGKKGPGLPLVIFTLLALAASASVGFWPERATIDKKVLFEAEGLMGKVSVVEEASSRGNIRSLYLNGLPQSIEIVETGCSGHTYVHQLSQIAGLFPAGSQTLMLGMGGGSLLKELLELSHEVDAVELDSRISEIAKSWFHVPTERANIFIDDARHHLNTLEKSYDLIVLDAFFGDNPPWQLITHQSLSRMATHLRPNGVIALFFPGPVSGPESLPAQGLIRTLHEAELDVAVVSTPKQGRGGRIFLATHRPFDYAHYPEGNRTQCVKGSGLPKRLPLAYDFEIQQGTVFTDDFPLLETLWRPANFNRKRL